TGVDEIRIPLRVRSGQPLRLSSDDIVLREGDVVLIESRDAATAREREVVGNVPAGTPPVMTLAVAAPDGRILIQVPAASPVRPGDGPAPALAWRWQMFGTPKIKASETDGKPIEGKALAERLQKM